MSTENSADAWVGDEQSAALDVVVTGAATQAIETYADDIASSGCAGQIAQRNPSLWGPDAEAEASKRMAWVDLPETSRPLVATITQLRDDLRSAGIDRVVLCGMGGSSLAPEVMAADAGADLVVLDTTQPDQVRAAVTALERTVVVVSSKSGSTIETDSHRRVFHEAFTQAGIDAADRIVIVTDPGSPLEAEAKAAGYRVFAANAQVGGRFSALTAFGLVPAGLAGVDIEAILDQAAMVSDVVSENSPSNPAVMVGAAMGATNPLRDKLIFVPDGNLPGFADWAEQLIAESTGKLGTGLLPVVVGSTDSPEVQGPAKDYLLVAPTANAPELDDALDAERHPDAADVHSQVTVAGPLGAQFLVWEYATAIAGQLLQINPFDQPDVESAKVAARSLLEETPTPTPADMVTGPIEVRATPGLLTDITTLDAAVAELLRQVPDNGYLAVMAYLDRVADAGVADIREDLARRLSRPVTFGWGPRFLHSTGQFHKGGPSVGAYLQITTTPHEDLAIPGREFTFGELIAAQAAGDAAVLAEHGRPVIRVHLTDHDAGLRELRHACRGEAL